MFGEQQRIEREFVSSIHRFLRAGDVGESPDIIAERMVRRTLEKNVRAWRQHVNNPAMWRRIRELIRSGSGALFATVERLIDDSARLLGSAAEMEVKNVALAARNAIAEVDSALTQAISEALGFDWYWWETRRDRLVRPSHKRFNRVLVNWHDPPSPETMIGFPSSLGHYNAGQAPNCRCVPVPIVRLSDVGWPHRVYFSGEIRYLTRAQFRHLTGPHFLR